MTGRRRFRGVYPVLYAFWTAAGRLDHGAMRAQVEHCVAAGAHGVMVLGLVTEVHRMSTAERQEVVEVVGASLAGRVPYAVTVAEADAAAQIGFARMAAANGADWVILQPPPGKGIAEDVLHRHFGAIADALPLPVAIQNNPVNLDSSLSPESLAALVRRHPTITLLKAEGGSVDIATTLSALDGAVDAFGGHGGLEFIAFLRSGGAGLIPAPDCLAVQVAAFEALTSGDPAAIALAERPAQGDPAARGLHDAWRAGHALLRQARHGPAPWRCGGVRPSARPGAHGVRAGGDGARVRRRAPGRGDAAARAGGAARAPGGSREVRGGAPAFQRAVRRAASSSAAVSWKPRVTL